MPPEASAPEVEEEEDVVVMIRDDDPDSTGAGASIMKAMHCARKKTQKTKKHKNKSKLAK